MASISFQQIVDSLSNPGKWTGSQITFSVPGASAVWSGYAAGEEPDDAGYGVFDTTQAAAFRLAVAAWDSLISPRIVEVSDASPGVIRAAFTNVDNFTTDASAYAYGAPSSGLGAAWAGDIWLDDSDKSSSFAVGGAQFHTLLHELGHALGLKHPFEGVSLPAEYDNQRYSIMSYDNLSDGVWKVVSATATGIQWTGAYVMPTTPMVFDIVAIQAKYGADAAAGAGDTTYRWSEAAPILETIYDTGGVDTFDLSAHTRASIIDLTPGQFSSVAYWSGASQAAYWTAIFGAGYASWLNGQFADADTYTWSRDVAIATTTTIENVIAGAGSDTVTGNDAGNVIYGRMGDDSIAGGAGEDYLRGDEGNDRIDGGDGFDDTHGNMGDDTVSGGAGDDWVVGGKDNDLLNGDDGADVVYGNLGNDTQNGGAGADWVRGGQGDDVLDGGAGDDWMAGDRGSDTLTGGAGADIFHTHGDAGIDRVLDFSRAEGDRVYLLAGTTYAVAQVGADVVINMTGGGQMTLVGVQMSSLSDGWIFGA